MMREEMELIRKERAELESQLSQRSLTKNQETNFRSMAEKIGTGLDKLDFIGKQ